MKKNMLQQFADSLSLSRVTVWKVLNNRPGVAPETANRIRMAYDKFNQGCSPDEAGINNFDTNIESVSLLISRADSSAFWMNIVDQIASELHLNKIRLNYIPVDVIKTPLSNLPEMLHPDNTDGIIVINIYDEALISTLASIDLPKVFFDTIPGHTTDDLQGDLILLEGERTMEAITKRLISKGCRRIGFIGDIHYAQTNLLRWNGYVKAMEGSGLPIDSTLCLTKSIDKDSYREDIGTFLDELKTLPDAFVCANDFVAFLVLSLLNERRCRIPDDLILSGYDDSKEFLLDHHGITTVHVQNAMLGKRMVNQLFYRIQNPEADFEEIQVKPKIIFRP